MKHALVENRDLGPTYSCCQVPRYGPRVEDFLFESRCTACACRVACAAGSCMRSKKALHTFISRAPRSNSLVTNPRMLDIYRMGIVIAVGAFMARPEFSMKSCVTAVHSIKLSRLAVAVAYRKFNFCPRICCITLLKAVIRSHVRARLLPGSLVTAACGH